MYNAHLICILAKIIAKNIVKYNRLRPVTGKKVNTLHLPVEKRLTQAEKETWLYKTSPTLRDSFITLVFPSFS